jgi:hypothetical protein
MNQLRLQYIYRYINPQGNSLYSHRYLKQDKTSCFSFYLFSSFSTKLENRRTEEVLPRRDDWNQWERGGDGKRG